MDQKIEEAKKKVCEYFLSHGAKGGTVENIKWLKTLLSDLVEASRLSVWEDVKNCPECGSETTLSRTCECGWFEESP
jgi:hypothetical protein